MDSIKELLITGQDTLKKKGIPSYNLDAEVLLAQAIGHPREFLYTYPREPVEKRVKNKFLKFLERRSQGEPLAYILGYKEFYGMDFLVGKEVLVPRPETESLVREAMISAPKKGNFNVWDIGTGSGCIAITLAKILDEELCLNKVFALDISKKALNKASKNAQKHKVKKLKLIKSDILDHFLKNKNKYKNIFKELNIIVANLPYLTEEQYKGSPSIQYEPRKALVASEGGLKCYRRLLEQIRKIPDLKFILILEIDPGQVSEMKKIINKNLPESEIEIKKDFSNQDRLIKVSS